MLSCQMTLIASVAAISWNSDLTPTVETSEETKETDWYDKQQNVPDNLENECLCVMCVVTVARIYTKPGLPMLLILQQWGCEATFSPACWPIKLVYTYFLFCQCVEHCNPHGLCTWLHFCLAELWKTPGGTACVVKKKKMTGSKSFLHYEGSSSVGCFAAHPTGLNVVLLLAPAATLTTVCRNAVGMVGAKV